MSGLPESKNKVKNKMRNILSIVFNRNDDADIVTLVVQNLEFKGTVLGNLIEGGAFNFDDVSVSSLPPAAQRVESSRGLLSPLLLLERSECPATDTEITVKKHQTRNHYCEANQ